MYYFVIYNSENLNVYCILQFSNFKLQKFHNLCFLIQFYQKIPPFKIKLTFQHNILEQYFILM